MGWLQQSYKQSQQNRSSGGFFFGRDSMMIQRTRRNATRRQPVLYLAALVTAALLGPLDALAFELAAPARVSKGQGGLQLMSEEELRRVFARGLPEEQLLRSLPFVANGLRVNILGDMGTLMHPLTSLVDAEFTFKDVVFNPLNPTVVIDRTGTYLMRVPDNFGTLSYENIHIRGSATTSFGSVTIRDIDMRGTMVRVTVRN